MKNWGIATATMLVGLAGMSAAAQAQSNRGRDDQGKQLPRQTTASEGKQLPRQTTVSPAEQQQRVMQQQQRMTQYRQQLGKQLPRVQQQTAQLHRQNRSAQYRVQQHYTTELRNQQQRIQTNRNFATDPYVRTPANYQYTISGTRRETNQYGAQMLRQGVNDGYYQGYLSGRADRTDHWRQDYQGSPAYLDANFGYTGNYVDQSDYNYYFRQGFQRGYEDGYNNRFQYGQASNGTYSILGSVLTSILGLRPIG